MVVTFIPQDCARNGFGARDPRRPSLFGLDEPLHLGGVAKADVAESRSARRAPPLRPAAHHTTSPTVATSTSTATVSTSNSILATSPGVTTSPYGGLDAIPNAQTGSVRPPPHPRPVAAS